jgi:dTDP-4-dehydrorhamnose 3,5-epimerase
MPQVLKTKLDKVLLIKPEIFRDHRGEFIESYNEDFYRKKVIDVKFVQDDLSVSSYRVLRGIHGHTDNKTYKLVSCALGILYLVIINCKTKSKKFGQWQAFTLSEYNRFQVLVPPGLGVAHLALSDKIIFHYKQSTYYDPKNQFTYRWNDPKFKIFWPIKNPILSKRDKLGHYVR